MAVVFTSRSHLFVLAVLALLLAGCGSGDDAGGSEGPASTAEAAAAAAGGAADTATDAAAEAAVDAADQATSGNMPAECQLPPVEVQVRRGGEMEPLIIQDGVADVRNEGISVFMQLTDFPLDPEVPVFEQVETPPPGGVAIGVGISHVTGGGFDPADFEPISTGDSGVVSATQPDLLVWADVFVDGDGLVSTGVTGDATVLWLDDQIVCMDVNVTSDSGGALVGVVAAPRGSQF